jgi:hypothetical protein
MVSVFTLVLSVFGFGGIGISLPGGTTTWLRAELEMKRKAPTVKPRHARTA